MLNKQDEEVNVKNNDYFIVILSVIVVDSIIVIVIIRTLDIDKYLLNIMRGHNNKRMVL